MSGGVAGGGATTELWEGKHDSFEVGWVVSAHGRVAARGYDSHRLAALPQSEGPKPLSASLDAHIILIVREQGWVRMRHLGLAPHRLCPLACLTAVLAAALARESGRR